VQRSSRFPGAHRSPGIARGQALPGEIDTEIPTLTEFHGTKCGRGDENKYKKVTK
jgi:hypothetical protein